MDKNIKLTALNTELILGDVNRNTSSHDHTVTVMRMIPDNLYIYIIYIIYIYIHTHILKKNLQKKILYEKQMTI